MSRENMTHRIINADCLDVLRHLPQARCIFADPPDNIGLKYSGYKDRLSPATYHSLLFRWLLAFVGQAVAVWLSYNARWWREVARATDVLCSLSGVEALPCVQTFTFGQHNQHDLGNNFRPLLRLQHPIAALYPDAIRVPSWRQRSGDKRADPRGRVPGDVFDFPRIVGNSKQRRAWHPTQLHEGLVERCILLTTQPGDLVIDPFAGTGTTLRVCKRIDRRCILIEKSREYCERIAEEHGMKVET